MLKFYYHKILINSYEFVRFTHSSHNLYIIYAPLAQLYRALVFGTDRQGFDNPRNKIITICFHGEMDITIDFGSIIEGSSPSGSTINPL